jgi:hypothetical protein
VAVALITLLVLGGTWALSDRTAYSALAASIAIGGAGLAAVLLPRNPVAAVGVVVVLSSFELLTLDLPPATMRMEQPAIAALVLAGGLHARRLATLNLRPVLPLLFAAGAYVLVLSISSVLVAPQPAASLRIVAWTLLSMAGGLAAAWLTAVRPARLFDWFTGAGV